jgi:hypothetical protein
MTRSLVVVTILCLTSTSALACMYDTQCEPGNVCLDSNCVRAHSSSDDDDVPAKRSPSKGKACGYDGDCGPGSRCIKGSGPEGVCIGH